MAFQLLLRGRVWYLRGAVCGRHVYETTMLQDRAYAEIIRIKRESALGEEYVFGAKAVRTFGEAVESYRASSGAKRFIARLDARFAGRPLHSLTQSDLDRAARELYPTATGETRNRQCYTPFIAVWNHAVANGWAHTRTWQRPRKVKGNQCQAPEARALWHPPCEL